MEGTNGTEMVSVVGEPREEYRPLHPEQAPGVSKKQAYRFDGAGNYEDKNWDMAEENTESSSRHHEFFWYHVELPNSDHSLSESDLSDVFPLKLKRREIRSLVSKGPFCGQVEDSIVFRVNSPGPSASGFIPRLAVRLKARSIVSVSHGRIPKIGFSSYVAEEELPEEADNPIPATVFGFLIHILNAYVDHLYDIVADQETQLDDDEIKLDRGGSSMKKQMIEDRRFPEMQLNLQRLLQVVAHGEQVFPMVKEKLLNKIRFAEKEIRAMEELIGRLRRLKENIGFRVNRINAIQVGLDSWQSGQINRELFFISFVSMIFAPLSIVTGVFGMNVGGVPWTKQETGELGNGFVKVILIFVGIIVIIPTVYFLYGWISTRRWWRALRRSSSWKKMFTWRNSNDAQHGVLQAPTPSPIIPV